jgi:hypothetical protein
MFTCHLSPSVLTAWLSCCWRSTLKFYGTNWWLGSEYVVIEHTCVRERREEVHRIRQRGNSGGLDRSRCGTESPEGQWIILLEYDVAETQIKGTEVTRFNENRHVCVKLKQKCKGKYWEGQDRIGKVGTAEECAGRARKWKYMARKGGTWKDNYVTTK